MKLYTEEQLARAMDLAKKNVSKNRIIESLTPIELPSDEEIQNKGECVFNNAGHNIYNHYNTIPSWVEGAQWLRDEILGGKK
jgi:hypothetical protein